jgi:hypothetical protein
VSRLTAAFCRLSMFSMDVLWMICDKGPRQNPTAWGAGRSANRHSGSGAVLI